jgi:hypothetical protein
MYYITGETNKQVRRENDEQRTRSASNGTGC